MKNFINNSVQGLIFDFDGTLFNSEPVHFEAYLEVLNKLDIQLDWESYENNFLGFEDSKIFEALFKANRKENLIREMPRFLKEKANAFQKRAHLVQSCPDSEDFLKRCASKYQLAICSGAYREDIEAIFDSTTERKKLRTLFKTIVTSSDTKNPKPDPEGYILATQGLNLKADQCLAFEDSPTGIKAAKDAHLKVFAIAHSLPIVELKKLTNHVFRGFTEIKIP